MSELFDRYERVLRARGAGTARISGAGRVAGGVYENLQISGAGSVDGDVEAERIAVAGSASFRGSVKAREVSLAGATKVLGDLRGGVLKSAGALSVMGVVDCEAVSVAGSLRAGAVRGSAVRLAGAFRVKGDVEAPLVEVKLSDDSRCRLLKGEEVSVEWSWSAHRVPRVILALLGRRRPTLKVELIEAKTVKLKDVVVDGGVKAARVYLEGEAEVLGPIEGEVSRI